MTRIRDVLDHPYVYRMWQAPFAGQKLQPVLESGILDQVSSVLDVGCGPGTNAGAFSTLPRYLGVDLNEDYIRYASNRYQQDFRVVDVTKGLPGGERFDAVLMNSLMHHLADEESRFLLRSLKSVLEEGGMVHVLDLVLPPTGLQRRMAMADRGDFARPPDQWLELVESEFRVVHQHEFDLGLGPLNLWRMVYFQLRE